LRRALPKHQKRDIVLHSACTGTFAERLAFDALGMKVGKCIGADPKPASKRFVLSNFTGVSHYFQTLQELTVGRGQCALHGAGCQMDGDGGADFAIFGPPCQPFTRQRARTDRSGATSRQSADSAGHPLYDVTMKDIIAYVAARRPHVVIIEQVPAFATMDSSGSTPITAFLQDLSRHVAAARVVELEQEDWINVCRTRHSVVRVCSRLSRNLLEPQCCWVFRVYLNGGGGILPILSCCHFCGFDFVA
jgi:hypothetical protein